MCLPLQSFDENRVPIIHLGRCRVSKLFSTPWCRFLRDRKAAHSVLRVAKCKATRVRKPPEKACRIGSRSKGRKASDLGEPAPESDSYSSDYLFTAVTNFRHFFGGDGSKDESDELSQASIRIGRREPFE